MSKATLEKAVKSAAGQASKPSLAWGTLEALGGLVCVANLPVGLLLGLSGAVGGAVSEKRDLHAARMPDTWLEQVAKSSEVSKEGLAHLARCLARQGFVSVSDAMSWMEIEREVFERQEQAKASEQAKKEPGACALLSRAQAECSDLLDASLVDKALDVVRSVSRFTPEALSVAARTVFRQ